MRRGAAFVIAVTLVCGLTGQVAAVQPDEMLADPGLEARARAISTGVRCLVCQNENIDDSDAGLARDLRILVRERVTAGDSDAEVRAYLVARYGEFVLLNPPAKGANLILWIAGPGLLLIGGGIAALYLRRRQGAAAPAPLTPEEELRLADLLRK